MILLAFLTLVATLATSVWRSKTSAPLDAAPSGEKRDFDALMKQSAELSRNLAALKAVPRAPCGVDDCAAARIISTPCEEAPPCPSCSKSAPASAPAALGLAKAPFTHLDYTYHPENGFAGGLEEWADRGVLFLPPDYCFIPPASGAKSPFKFLSPKEVTYEADGACHWAEMSWKPAGSDKPVFMCTHDPLEDLHVSKGLHGHVR